MLQGSLSLSLSIYLSLSLSLSIMHQHTDYMDFFIIHVAFLPLLESIQEKRQEKGMKCEGFAAIIHSPSVHFVQTLSHQLSQLHVEIDMFYQNMPQHEI